ncbi:mRNA-degrading endonuclease RelE of RelBE toxin-antitoxin system [Enterococcus sp. PF1-24]|uniref:type II toxin-antitoxin system RelE/ParE family toxin n=1 Tax=unclassified Enterococcus TaxID=2608891 RepID=UPI00247461E2|nr:MULTISPECIES: type II toxin-antitoxin system RelE/ParE family toxin [unclassified Enterococcus]MDH6364048.1 mRNA-degrading endonuclease RelE of RelBE toxin-antitoxin system [Enterococcus sp. PFB1-1]MDH6401149.1 mRNA-degrading endonuclease RelE of RelBE toxin-antitoxin system [Enterococcus sp. PF1-24]
MNEYKVKISNTFDNDMNRIMVYLKGGNYYPETVKQIFETIYQDLKRLRTSPKIGGKLSSKTTIDNDYRYLVSGQYLIFYKIFENQKLVQVYQVYHGKENYLVKLNLV